MYKRQNSRRGRVGNQVAHTLTTSQTQAYYFIDMNPDPKTVSYTHLDVYKRQFQKMLAEIEAGHVEVVITKDLSRLGRNSSLTGLYICW